MIGLWNLARSAPERVAAIETDTGRSITRGELAQHLQPGRSTRCRVSGVGTGGVIALVMENEIPLLEVFFAGLQAGWYVVPINYHFTADEIGYILADSDTQAVFCSTSYTDVVGVAASLPEYRRRCASPSGAPTASSTTTTSYEGSRPTGRATAPPVG